jgi:hypothetical protein
MISHQQTNKRNEYKALLNEYPNKEKGNSGEKKGWECITYKTQPPIGVRIHKATPP